MNTSRSLAGIFALTSMLLLGSCMGPGESPAQRQADADSAAGRAGKVAHSVAKDAGKISEEAARKLAHAAHQAKEGWDEAAREDAAKGKK